MTSSDTILHLRPYQEVGVQWMLERRKCILADDTGIGKTAQAIAALAHNLPALVVARDYLLQDWYTALTEALPYANINLPVGAHARKAWELSHRADVTLVSYSMLRTHLQHMPKVQTIVLDEAHNIRNRNAAQSHGALALCHATDNVYLLTATPYYKTDEDIYNLLYAVAPEQHASYWDFIRRWFSVNWSAPYAPKIYGISKQKRAEWLAHTQQYMLMRTYQDVGRQLPSLVERHISFELPRPLRQAYDIVKKKWQIAGIPIEDVGSLLWTLRDLTMCAPKVQAVVGIVESLPHDKVLVYTWYKEHAQQLAKQLPDALLLTGDTPPLERARLLAIHRVSNIPRPIVATIESLSEGVNLQYMHHVVYAEETYVRGKHHQTTRRVQRDRGDTCDTQPVIVYYVRAKRTIDDLIPNVRNSRAKASELKQIAEKLAT